MNEQPGQLPSIPVSSSPPANTGVITSSNLVSQEQQVQSNIPPDTGPPNQPVFPNIDQGPMHEPIKFDPNMPQGVPITNAPNIETGNVPEIVSPIPEFLHALESTQQQPVNSPIPATPEFIPQVNPLAGIAVDIPTVKLIPQTIQQEIDLPFGEGEMFVSNSRLEGVAKCALMSALKLLKYRNKKAQPVMESGTAIHEGIYEFLRTGDVEKACVVVENYYRPIVEKADEVFPAYELHNILAIITEYCARNTGRNWPWIYSPEGIEVGFEAPLFGKVKVRGLIDILVRDKATNQIAFVDVKSTGKMDASKEKIWSMSTQFAQYTHAIKEIYKEEVYGGYVEGIHVKKLPTDKKKCKEHGVPYHKCSEKHAYFKTVPVPQNPQKLANWKMTAIGLAQKLWNLKKIVKDKSVLDSIPNQGMFNMSCQYCEFKDYCELGRQERVLDTMYEVVDYDPFLGRPMIKDTKSGV